MMMLYHLLIAYLFLVTMVLCMKMSRLYVPSKWHYNRHNLYLFLLTMDMFMKIQRVRINHAVFLIFTLVIMLALLPCTVDNAVSKCQMMLHFTSYIQYMFFHHFYA